ncbi:uncharacterized protein N7477_009539 [Penicillium maclennaniae]|uniref:uncharacterized protein n=1 Tax=Penicillium maclennaniae TaxID=1343394 RepID=UPI00253FC390|nr:uncharacterized protein N7477_009539 [Penicillium maclennaniae]KAJ5661923.1 hypothetical protein N7477_009539 [Penicillium maclennaniae]
MAGPKSNDMRSCEKFIPDFNRLPRAIQHETPVTIRYDPLDSTYPEHPSTTFTFFIVVIIDLLVYRAGVDHAQGRDCFAQPRGANTESRPEVSRKRKDLCTGAHRRNADAARLGMHLSRFLGSRGTDLTWGSRAQAAPAIQDDDFEVRREAQRLSTENARLTAQVRQLTAKNQSARSDIRQWKQKFDDATFEIRDHVPREEVQRMLRELHDDAVSFAGRIGTKNESENLHLFSALPGPNVAQGQDTWQSQQGQFKVLHDPILPENVGSIFPTADEECLQFCDYLNVPPA